MKRLINLLWYKTNNVGDTMTSPLDYYTFPLPCEKIDVKDVGNHSEFDDAFVIIGGGGIIHLPVPDYNNGIMGYWEPWGTVGKYRVVWGAGHNIHFHERYDWSNMLMPKELAYMNYVGLRDLSYKENVFFDHVPCVSCKHHEFDKPVNAEFSVGIYHKQHSPNDFLHKLIYCEEIKGDDLLAVLRTADKIYTDSYHVMYWSELFGKKAIVTRAYSTKFYLHQPLSLEEARRKNDLYYEKILKLINKYMEEPE